jgi:hypothetical protein
MTEPRDPNSDQTFKHVIEHTELIDQVKDRHICLFFGQAQTGKTLTITDIRKAVFDRVRKPGSQPKLCAVKSVPNMGLIAQGNPPGMMFPIVYDGTNGILLADIRDVGEIGETLAPELILATWILLEMMCLAAKSVRILTLASYHALEQLSLLRPVMELIENLLINPDDPIGWPIIRHAMYHAGNGPNFDMQRERFVMDAITSPIEEHGTIFSQFLEESQVLITGSS